MRYIRFLIVVVMLVCCGVAFCHADTVIADDITTDTTWSATGSAYVVDRTIRVQAGATLTILPGVTIRMDEGVSIDVHGTLLASGTDTSHVTITGKSITSQVLVPPPEPVDGELMVEAPPVYRDEVTIVQPKGLSFAPGARAVVSYVAMDQLTDPIDADRAMIALDHVLITRAITGVYATGGVLSVTNTTFNDTVIPAKVGLDVDFTHSANTFTETQYPGWNFFGDGYNQDVHLVAGDGVYILSSPLSIAAEHSITIDPGVTLLLANNASVDIYGKLTAQGTASNPITIAPLLSTMRSSVFVMSDDPIVFEHVNYSLGEELFFLRQNISLLQIVHL